VRVTSLAKVAVEKAAKTATARISFIKFLYEIFEGIRSSLTLISKLYIIGLDFLGSGLGSYCLSGAFRCLLIATNSCERLPSDPWNLGRTIFCRAVASGFLISEFLGNLFRYRYIYCF